MLAIPANEPMVDDAALDAALRRVGPRLRQLRLERDATLADLAAETGNSVSTLSRLESGGRKPTLELLLALAKAHRVALDELVDAPETGDPRVRTRPVKRHGMTFLPLTRRPGGLQAFEQVLPPRPNTRPDPRTHEDYEWLYVLSGRLRLVLGGRTWCCHPARWSSSTPAHPIGSATQGQSRPRRWRSTGRKASGCTCAPNPGTPTTSTTPSAALQHDGAMAAILFSEAAGPRLFRTRFRRHHSSRARVEEDARRVCVSTLWRRGRSRARRPSDARCTNLQVRQLRSEDAPSGSRNDAPSSRGLAHVRDVAYPLPLRHVRGLGAAARQSVCERNSSSTLLSRSRTTQ